MDLVGKVFNVLSGPDEGDPGGHETMEEDPQEGDFFEGEDEDMTLAHYQNDIKLEALA